mgnify:CR=1 FL=1
MHLDKSAYHKKPTYDEMVIESITHPTDKIALPDRQATQLRNTPQLTRYDDESFTDLNKDNQTQILEQLKQINLRQVVATHSTHTHTIERAVREDAPMPQAPPPPGPPPASGPRFGGAQPRPRFTSSYHSAFSQEPTMRHSGVAPGPPPPPPGSGGAAVPVDHVREAHFKSQFEYANAALGHIARNVQEQKEAISRGMAAHLGPQVVNNNNFITQVMERRSPGGASSSAGPIDVVMGSGDYNPPPPPPATGAIISNTMGATRAQPQVFSMSKRGRSSSRVAPPNNPQPPQPPAPPAPGIDAVTTNTQQKRGRKIGQEQQVLARRRYNSKTTPPSREPAARAKHHPK